MVSRQDVLLRPLQRRRFRIVEVSYLTRVNKKQAIDCKYIKVNYVKMHTGTHRNTVEP